MRYLYSVEALLDDGWEFFGAYPTRWEANDVVRLMPVAGARAYRVNKWVKS